LVSQEKQKKVFAYIDSQIDRYVEELSEIVRYRSVSSEGTGMLEGAKAVARLVQASGFESEVNIQKNGNPIVTGCTGKSKSKRVGIYGHYDVFPEGDVSKWIVNPYEPKVIDKKLYGRGTTDDKGNLFANVKAAEAVKTVLGDIPVDLAFLFEGEEEIGSKSLKGFLDKKRDAFSELIGFIACDRGWHESGRPQVFLGCKSNVTFTVKIRYADRNIHSGQAPIIPNPAWELLHLMSKIRDDKGNIRIPVLQEEKFKPTDQDIQLLRTIPFDIEEYKLTYGIQTLTNEKSNLDALKELVFGDSCNINNFVAGSEGANGIIPGYATTTVDMRLSSEYDPYKLRDSLVDMIKQISPDAEVDTFVMHGYRSSPNDEFVKDILNTIETTFQEPVVWPQWDGSGPLGILSRSFGVPAMIIGLGAPFSKAKTHSDNEYIGLVDIKNGIKLMASIFMNAWDKN
jgi:acetylornithine deacetylase/succinyl-diaminopimelate desuccinylase-like protein